LTDGLRQLGSVLSEPFLNPYSRTHWVGLLVFLGVAAIWTYRRPKNEQPYRSLGEALKHPSSALDLQLLAGRQMLRALVGVPTLTTGWLLGTHGVRWLDSTFGAPTTPEIPAIVVASVYTLTLFVVWDLSRFLLHVLMHKIPFLWSVHQVHHSAEVLTPLTFHRVHPIESWLYDFRGALSTGLVAGIFYYLFRGQLSHFTLFGVPALAFVLNLATGNLRHSHVWISFPRPIERWLLSPAQHQIHHSADKKHHGSNYGTWLSTWDRMFGSWLPSSEQPSAYGLSKSERNHDNHLLSAWFGPLKGAVPTTAAIVFILGFSAARAEENPEEETEDSPTVSSENEPSNEEVPEEARPPSTDRYGEEMFIYEDGRTPRVAGSAHKVEEQELERFEHNNIEQIVAQVPGVSTRGEDGYGLRPNIGIRGASSDRSAKITLMEDGVLLAPAPYAAPAAYYFPMSTRLVGVEVFKGPASTRHGPYTVGGALNVLTRDLPDESSAYADLAAGLRSTTKAHIWAGAIGDSTGTLIEAVNLRSDGFKVLDSGGPTGFDRSELMLKSEWLATADQRLELKLGYATEKSQETYLGLSQSDWEATPYRRYSASALGDMKWKRTQTELEWSGRLAPNVQIRSVAYHHWLDRSWTKFNAFAGGINTHGLLKEEPGGQSAVYLAILRGEENSLTDDQNLLIGTNHRIFHSFGLQTTAEWAIKTDVFSSQLEMGLRLHGDNVRRLHTESPFAMLDGLPVATGGELDTTLDSQATARAMAAHLHEDLSIGRLHLFPGVRVEIIQGWRADVGEPEASAITRATTLPGMGILVEATSTLDVFVGANRGFSPVAPGQAVEVSPELSWNYEAGARLDP
jgi:Fe(3+) dicitrate transport protein